MQVLRLAPFFASTCVALSLAPLANAQRIKLSHPLARVAVGDVLAERVSHDERFVVYAADPADTGSTRLFRAWLDGSAPVSDLGVEGTGLEFELTPDDARVVYRSQVAGGSALFSVPSDGSAAPVRLSPDVAGSVVTHFRLSPDAQRVVYRADLGVATQFELFAVPVGGGPTVRVNAPLFADGDVQPDFVIAPDSLGVFYRANPRLRTALDLLRGSVLGRQPVTRINTVHGNGQTVEEFRLTPDGRTLVYRADSAANERFELYRAASDGSVVPQVVNGPLVAFGDVSSFELSADGKRVAYLADQRVRFLTELYSVPLAGGVPLRLNPDLVTGGDVLQAHFTPDGRQLVFTMRSGARQPAMLFRVATDGSAPSVRLDDDTLALVEGFELALTRDGTRVLFARLGAGTALLFSAVLVGPPVPVQLSVGGGGPYRLADDDRSVVMQEAGRLLSRRVDGSGPVAVLREPATSSFVVAFEPAGERVLLRETVQLDFALERTDLLRAPLDGSAAAEAVSSPFAPGPIAERVMFSKTAGTSAAYSSRGPAGGRLFGVSLDGGSPAVLLNGPEAEDSYFDLTPDGRDIVYSGGGELRVRSVDGSGAPLVLGTELYPLVVTPDGSRVLAVGDGTAPELVSVPLDASSPPIVLGGALAYMPGLEVTRDSSRVLFLSGTGPELVLLGAPCDGSASTVRLNPAGTFAYRFSVAQDGSWVVFEALDGSSSVLGLYGAPTDGSAPATLLVPVSTGLLQDFAVSSESDRLVYLLDGEVLSMPLHGGTSIALDGGATAFTDRFFLTRDGSRVVYLTLSDSGADFLEAFSIPSDGLAPPIHLGAKPVGPGQFARRVLQMPFELTADDSLAVYRSSDELVAAPLDGSAPPRRLMDGLDSFLPLGEVHTTPDSSAVVVHLIRTDFSPALFGVLLDGSRSPRDLLGPTVAHGGIGVGAGELKFSADSSRILYLGDLDVDTVRELYMSPLDRPHRGSAAPERTVSR